MKLLNYILICAFLFAMGCKQESTTTDTIDNNDTLSTSQSEFDSLKSETFEKDKWITLNEEVNDTSDAFGYVPSKKRLEKRLKKEFETIDPLEYYLSENVKFSDKKAMKKKREKIANLNKMYNSNYYDLGHIPERRNNANMMLSLTNTTYPLKSYASLSDDFSDNKNIVDMKSGIKNFRSASSDDLKSVLNNAVQLINLSQLTEAEGILSNLEEYGCLTKDYLVFYNKAFIRFQFSDYNEAVKNAKKSINFRKNFYLNHLLIGDSYLLLGSNEKAYQYYTEALKIKENIVSLERVAYTALLLGKGNVSEDYYSKIVDKYNGKDKINYLAGYALALAYNGKNDVSLKIVKQLKAQKKDWSVAYLIEGWNELILGNNENAEKAFSYADKYGEKLYSTVGRAICYYNRKDYVNASKLFYYLEENPKYKKLERNPTLLMYSGYSFANTYDFNSAFVKFMDYAAIVKKDDCYYIGMSLCSYGNDDFSSAEAFLDRVGIQSNNLPEYYYLKGVYALRNDRYKNAKDYFEKSLLADKKNIRAINGLGAALKGLENYEKSISVFNEGLKLQPNDPFLLFNKASSVFNVAKKLYEKDLVKQAKDTMKVGLDLMNRVVAIDPSFIINVNIGNAYASIKDSATALSYYRKVNNPAVDVNIGSLYAGLNMIDKAKDIWEGVLATDSSFVLADENIKAIYMSDNSPKSKKKTERFHYYENYYFQIGYHWKAPIPVLYESSFEPLVPLGYSNLKFTKISN